MKPGGELALHHPLSKLTEKAQLRFWSKVQITPHCWTWTAKQQIAGYGAFTVAAGDVRLAHRLSFELFNGERPPKGLVVRHRCDEPLCVNPDHLLLGTHADNMRDKVARGRQARGEKSGASKLNDAAVREIRTASGTNAEIGARYGISGGQVSMIRNRRAWSHVA